MLAEDGGISAWAFIALLPPKTRPLGWPIRRPLSSVYVWYRVRSREIVSQSATEIDRFLDIYISLCRRVGVNEIPEGLIQTPNRSQGFQKVNARKRVFLFWGRRGGLALLLARVLECWGPLRDDKLPQALLFLRRR